MIIRGMLLWGFEGSGYAYKSMRSVVLSVLVSIFSKPVSLQAHASAY